MVQVTVSQSCAAVAYNQQAVQVKALQLLTSVATLQLGTGYTLTGTVQVTITQAIITPHTKPVVFSFTCVGTWVYTLSAQEQQHIKERIAGRTKRDALRLLLSQKGIDKATIAGIPDTKKLPDDLTHIHLFIIVEE